MRKLFLILLNVILLLNVSYSTEVKITASDPDWWASFGYSVSISGDYVIAGAYQEDSGGAGDEGAAYIYYRNQGGTDNWGQIKKLTASDAEAGDRFGYSVSISGNYAVVGAYSEDEGGSSSGAAYLFNRNQGGPDNWGQVTKLTASDAEPNDMFGTSVSISADYLIVGANGENSELGAAYIYYRNQGGADNWGQVRKLTASNSWEFGISVSIDGDYAIVGSWKESSGNGAAYIYYRNQGGTDNWGQVKRISDADGGNFGYSVSISGNYVIVGAYNEDSGGDNAGAAYIYYRNQGGTDNWGQVTQLASSDLEAWDNFGISVSISGDYAIVGAKYEDEGGSQAGAAYSFLRDGSSWNETSKTIASDAAADDNFGISVSIDGDHAVIGANQDDDGETNTGAAYIYESISDLSLPVELSSFAAVSNNKKVTLEWSTESETDNLGFIIKRSAEKNGVYHQLASYTNNKSLKGAGNSSQHHNYSFIDKTVINGFTYWYKLIDVDVNGLQTEHGPISATPNISDADISLTDEAELPESFALLPNYPNPFNPTTTIQFDVPKSNIELTNISLKIHNALGRHVRTLFSGTIAPGHYKLTWDGTNINGSLLPSGIYFCTMSTTHFTASRKMILMK